MDFHSFVVIGDWSVESFALSSFTIFFVSMPALFLVVHSLLGYGKTNELEKINGSAALRKETLLLAILIYVVGLFIFTLLTSGGNEAFANSSNSYWCRVHKS